MCMIAAEGTAPDLLDPYSCAYNRRAVKGSGNRPGGVGNCAENPDPSNQRAGM